MSDQFETSDDDGGIYITWDDVGRIETPGWVTVEARPPLNRVRATEHAAVTATRNPARHGQPDGALTFQRSGPSAAHIEDGESWLRDRHLLASQLATGCLGLPR